MPKIVDKDEMRARIMDAALRSFSRSGYHAAKMTDVAAEAGLAKGTLYLYFPGKDDLTVALLERYFGELRMSVASQPEPDHLSGFLHGLRAALDLPPETLGATRLFFDVLGPGFELEQGRQVIGGFFGWLGQRYGATLRALQATGEVNRAIDPDAAGAAIASMIDGLVIHLALFRPDRDEFAKRLDAAMSLLADGLRNR